MVYDLNTNITQLAEKREQVQSPAVIAASALLRRFSEYGAQHVQCSLFPAVRDLLTNLQIPNDVPPPNQVSHSLFLVSKWNFFSKQSKHNYTFIY